jgi:hypothetical protein
VGREERNRADRSSRTVLAENRKAIEFKTKRAAAQSAAALIRSCQSAAPIKLGRGDYGFFNGLTLFTFEPFFTALFFAIFSP